MTYAPLDNCIHVDTAITSPMQAVTLLDTYGRRHRHQIRPCMIREVVGKMASRTSCNSLSVISDAYSITQQQQQQRFNQSIFGAGSTQRESQLFAYVTEYRIRLKATQAHYD